MLFICHLFLILIQFNFCVHLYFWTLNFSIPFLLIYFELIIFFDLFTFSMRLQFLLPMILIILRSLVCFCRLATHFLVEFFFAQCFVSWHCLFFMKIDGIYSIKICQAIFHLLWHVLNSLETQAMSIYLSSTA